MHKVEKELQGLKLKTEQDEMKQIFNKSMYELWETLNFFREQALCLEQKYESEKKEKFEWKSRAEGLESEVKFLEQLVSKMREENKVMKEIGTVSNPILSFVTPVEGFEGDEALSPRAAITRALEKRIAHTSQGIRSNAS